MGGITEIATGAPGYCSVLPNSMSPLARTSKLNGYSTAQFGKCHEVPVWETSPAGPFDAWPTGGGGFEYSTASSAARRTSGTRRCMKAPRPVEPEKTPEEGYHLMEDMTDKAIDWIGQQKSLAPDKPFFIYFAPGATHAPHHVPKEWADKYKGKFDQGWDKLREEIFARQKKLGVIPQDCELTPRHKEIPGLGRDAGRIQAGAAPARWKCTRASWIHRSPCGPAGRVIDQAGHRRRHAHLLHRRRQRRLRGRVAQRLLQRDELLQRSAGPRDPRIPHGPHRQTRRARILQPLRSWLGARDEHAIPVDQTGRVALGRDAQRHDRPLAKRHQGQRRDPLPIQPRHRRRANDP